MPAWRSCSAPRRPRAGPGRRQSSPCACESRGVAASRLPGWGRSNSSIPARRRRPSSGGCCRPIRSHWPRCTRPVERSRFTSRTGSTPTASRSPWSTGAERGCGCAWRGATRASSRWSTTAPWQTCSPCRRSSLSTPMATGSPSAARPVTSFAWPSRPANQPSVGSAKPCHSWCIRSWRVRRRRRRPMSSRYACAGRAPRSTPMSRRCRWKTCRLRPAEACASFGRCSSCCRCLPTRGRSTWGSSSWSAAACAGHGLRPRAPCRWSRSPTRRSIRPTCRGASCMSSTRAAPSCSSDCAVCPGWGCHRCRFRA